MGEGVAQANDGVEAVLWRSGHTGYVIRERQPVPLLDHCEVKFSGEVLKFLLPTIFDKQKAF